MLIGIMKLYRCKCVLALCLALSLLTVQSSVAQTGKGGAVYKRRTGFCLETQHFPDSPNQPSFPSTILKPGQEYRSRTVFTFGVTK